MRVLITGISGFVGHYLTAELLAAGHTVLGIDLTLDNMPPGVSSGMQSNLTDAPSIDTAVNKLRPDACIHLGGIASPPIGRKNPQLMLNTNVLGTAFLLEALHKTVPQCRFLLASTAFVYGATATEKPITEDNPLLPSGIYAVSKAAADAMTLGYAREHRMAAMTARPANHTGPGQSAAFVVASFVQQIKAIAAGERQPLMLVGNLASRRSFMDVRDVVRAYRLLIEQGKPGRAYNIASPELVPIRFILETLCDCAGIDPEIEVDPELFRPTDCSPVLATERIKNTVGWQAEIPLKQTLHDMLAQPETEQS